MTRRPPSRRETADGGGLPDASSAGTETAGGTRAQSTRAALLEAAREVFSAAGYDGAGMALSSSSSVHDHAAERLACQGARRLLRGEAL